MWPEKTLFPQGEKGSCCICAVKTMALLLLACSLAACGNAYEYLQLEPWQSVGTAEIPGPLHPKKREFEMVQLAIGKGIEIIPGSLVHARFDNRPKRTRLDVPNCGGTNEPKCQPRARVDDVWFWVGKEKVDRDLGNDAFRTAFIGVRNGGRLSLIVRKGGGIYLPTKVFLLHYSIDPNGRGYIMYDHDRLEMGGNEESQYEIEVMRVCEGKLLQRQALLKQWGYQPHLWAESPNYPFAREGTLEWMAMEAQCESPKETIRFEKGPAYDSREGTLEGHWPESYREAIKWWHF